jgi:hypothetical protein
MASILRWQKETAARRLAVWMAVGAAFVLGLAVSEYSQSAKSITPTALFSIMALAALAAGLVSIGARQPYGARFRLRLLKGNAPPMTNPQRKAPIPFPVAGKK